MLAHSKHVSNSKSLRRRLAYLTACAACTFGLWLLHAAVTSCPVAEHGFTGQPPESRALDSLTTSVALSELAYAGSEGPEVCKKGPAHGLQLAATDALVSPLVVVAHNRVTYVARTMTVLLTQWTADAANKKKFPLYISVDGGDPRTLLYALALQDAAEVQVLSRVRDRSKCDFYDCHISLHFKMLLQVFFKCLKAPRLLFLEEDLEVSPDFFSYFEAMARLMDQDESLWCVSAWNDHGQQGRALNNTALYRTDIIPGLGWMTNARHGKKLADDWPDTGWDHWMRRAEHRKGRQCVFPEVPRTHTFGKEGAHSGKNYDNNAHFNRYLSTVMLNRQKIYWSRENLSYLLKDNYAALMQSWLAAAVEYDRAKYGSLASYCDVNKPLDAKNPGDLFVTYQGGEGTPTAYMNVTKSLVPMLGDLASGFARASYDGVVMVRCRGRRLFLRPLESLGPAAKTVTPIH